MRDSESETHKLLECAKKGDEDAFALLFEQYRDRLTRMVTLRMDRRLAGRIDAADVIQDAYLLASRRFSEFVSGFRNSFHLWLRLVVNQVLIDLNRRHLGAGMRSVSVEVPLSQGHDSLTDGASLAELILSRLTTASRAAIRKETRKLVRSAMDSMEPIDREILMLRHFEMLTNGETADVVGLSKAAASNRYIRALRRLKDCLADLT